VLLDDVAGDDFDPGLDLFLGVCCADSIVQDTGSNQLIGRLIHGS
jgi:hypothetical protein